MPKRMLAAKSMVAPPLPLHFDGVLSFFVLFRPLPLARIVVGQGKLAECSSLFSHVLFGPLVPATAHHGMSHSPIPKRTKDMSAADYGTRFATGLCCRTYIVVFCNDLLLSRLTFGCHLFIVDPTTGDDL